MEPLEVWLAGVRLKNPVIPASGTFGFGEEFASFYDLDLLGAISVKGTTREARYGNPLPRIAEAPSGMLNSVGLQNPGVEIVATEEIPRLAKKFHGPIIANVGGFSIDEYRYNAERLSRVDEVAILEINISCPNLHGGGVNFASTPEGAASVARAVKEVASKPVFMKLSPNVTDIVSIAGACEDAGADGLVLINTLLGMRIDLRTGRPVLANRTGGLSGPAIFPVALRMVYDVYAAVGIPIIGCGGVSSAEDLCEMMMAGASAVEIGAANLVDPTASRDIAMALGRLMEKLGIERISSLTGLAHGNERKRDGQGRNRGS